MTSRYFRTLGLAVSILLNAIIAGNEGQTLSCRLALWRQNGSRTACVLCRLFDFLDFGHCDRARDFWARYMSANARRIDREESGRAP